MRVRIIESTVCLYTYVIVSQIFVSISVFCDENSTFTLNSVDVFGLLVSLKYLMLSASNIFQEKLPNFLRIPQNLMNDAIFKICFVAYYIKVLIQTQPSWDHEGYY